MDRSTPPRKHVLVVEDDRVLRLALSRLLAEAHAVDEAADGPTALAKLEQGRFDLVLLDIGLPGLNGLDVLTRVHAAGNGKAPRVVVMTADDTPETLLRAIRQQAYDYVVKPFPPSAILDIAARALAAPDDALAIQVLSARPDWVELLVPCSLDVADRLQNFMMRLETGLPEDVRESVGMAFRELLCNAIEWGGSMRRGRCASRACARSGWCSIGSPTRGRASGSRSSRTRPSATRQTAPWTTRSCANSRGCAPAASGCSSCARWWTSCSTTRRATKSSS
jgi:CheY-like chemotaxis protein